MRIFRVDLRYRWQDMGKNVCFLALKPVLRHFPFLILHFGYTFASIGGSVAKIRAKTCIHRLWNRFYGIHRAFFSTFEVILRRSDVLLPRYLWKRPFSGLETGSYCIRRCCFSTFILFLLRLELPLLRYGLIRVFSCLETDFRVITVLFLALWILFCIDQRYQWHNIGENVCFKALKSVLWHLPYIF